MRHDTMNLSMAGVCPPSCRASGWRWRARLLWSLWVVTTLCLLRSVAIAATLDHDTMWYLSQITPNGDGWATASFVAKPLSAQDAELVGDARATRYSLYLFSSRTQSGVWRAPRQAVEHVAVPSVSRLNDIACPGRATPAQGEVCHTAIILPHVKEALGSDARKICQVVGSEHWTMGLERSCVVLAPAR